MKNNKIKLILKCILAFIIPLLIILTYIFYKEITVGNYILKCENFLMGDMASQYNSIYNYIWDVLRGNQSLFYSLGKSLGGNMASTVAYYAGSPLNILYLFCSKANIPIMTFIIYLIKVGLSSLFAYLFFNYKFRDSNSNILFAVTYSLIGYTVNFYFNNMWLDVVALTPLILLGLEKLIKEKKILMYSITLGISIISNFYISYMLCIFIVIYFVYQILLNYKIRNFKSYKDIMIKFIIGSFIGLGIASILLIPALLNLRQIKRAPLDINYFNINFKNFGKYFIDNFFAKLYIGSHNLSSHLSRENPNLYCGILTIVLNFYYYCNKNIKLKEKLLSLGILLIFILSFMIPHLNFFWHAFAIPNGYIGRFSFLFSFYMIFISVKSFLNLDKIKIWKIVLFVLGYAFITYIIYLNIKSSQNPIYFIQDKDLIITTIFVYLYLFLITFITYIKSVGVKKYFRFILYICVIIELFINFKLCFITNKDLNLFGSPSEYYTEVCPIINNLDKGFYRVDGSYKYSLLDSFICNSKTYGSSLSTNDGALYTFWKENGGDITYTTIFYDLNKLPIFDSLFGVKYIKSDYEFVGTYYKKYKTFTISGFDGNNNNPTKKYIYKNPYALSLGYLIPKNHINIYNSKKVSNSFESLNRFMKTLSGSDEDILKPYKQKYYGEGKYEVDINNDSDYIFLSFDYDIYTNSGIYFPIFINEKYIGVATSEDIGNFRVNNEYKNEKIRIKIGTYEHIPNMDTMVAYYLDIDSFKRNIKMLKRNQLTNIKISGNKIEGDIKVDKKSTLFMSIPYDKGWNIYVDGKKTSYEKIANEFIGIDLKKGNHNIKMVYISPGFISGTILTTISIVTLIFYSIFKKGSRKKYETKKRKTS